MYITEQGHESSIVPIWELVAININYGKNIVNYVIYTELEKIRFMLKYNDFYIYLNIVHIILFY
jgi:uncharacterized membrane protein